MSDVMMYFTAPQSVNIVAYCIEIIDSGSLDVVFEKSIPVSAIPDSENNASRKVINIFEYINVNEFTEMYDIALWAVDKDGNQSKSAIIERFVFDIDPPEIPEPPTNLNIVTERN